MRLVPIHFMMDGSWPSGYNARHNSVRFVCLFHTKMMYVEKDDIKRNDQSIVQSYLSLLSQIIPVTAIFS